MSRHTASLFAFVVASALIMSACQPKKETVPSPSPSLVPVMESSTPTVKPSSSPTSATQPPATGKRVSFATNYQSPAQLEQVNFVVEVDANGVITDAKTDVLAVHPISVTRQTAFAEGFPTALKGKKLSELTQIDRIGGSSLTTGAFNKALAELKAQL